MCFFCSYVFSLSLSISLSPSQMKGCSGKRTLASGMRQIWTCPTRRNLNTPMTVSSLSQLLFCKVVVEDLVLALCLYCTWSLFSNFTLCCCRDRVAAAVCAKQQLERVQPRWTSSVPNPQKGGWC